MFLQKRLKLLCVQVVVDKAKYFFAENFIITIFAENKLKIVLWKT